MRSLRSFSTRLVPLWSPLSETWPFPVSPQGIFTSSPFLSSIVSHHHLHESLLSARDYNIVVGGFQICEDLMKKLPAIFKIYFKKEGVVHELRRLAALTPGAPTPPPAQHATPSPSPQSPASSTPTREPTRRLADLMRRLKDKTSGSETSSEQPAQPEFVPASPRTPKAGSQSKGAFAFSALLAILVFISPCLSFKILRISVPGSFKNLGPFVRPTFQRTGAALPLPTPHPP